MVEKGINFIFCLGTAYDVSSMESVGMLQVVFVGRKSMHLYKSLVPSAKGLSLTYAISIFEFESPSSLIKHQLGAL